MRSIMGMVIFGIVLLTAVGSAHACQGGVTTSTVRPVIPATITSARDANRPGALIGPGASANTQGLYLYSCNDGKVSKVGVKATGKLVPNVTYGSGGQSFPVYETGIPGIGVALMAGASSSASLPGNWKPLQTEETLLATSANQITFFYIVNYQAALVFTGSLVTGTYTIPPLQVGISKAYGPDGGVAHSDTAFLNGMTIKVAASGCTLTSGKQMNIKLPQLVGNKLQAIGAVSDEAAPVTLRVDCQGAVNVYATLSDVANQANEDTILSALPGSTSRGIGLQIYKQGSETPLHFGPDSAVKGNKNQWLAGTVTDASLSIPLVARYVKTAETFTPGSLNAGATFTFSYQ